MTNIAVDFSQLDTSPFSTNALLIKLEVAQNKYRNEVVVHVPHT